MSEKDGGPAFPLPNGQPSSRADCDGMSLRDYFAGQALAGMMADVEGWGPKEELAAHAYALADAMLEAREVKS